MAGRRLRVTWEAADSVEGLRPAYRHEGDGAVRMRLHGLWLLRRGQRVGEVAATVGVHDRPMQRWVRWYEAGGLTGVRAHQHGGAGPPPRLRADQQAQVAVAVGTGRFRSTAEIGAWIGRTLGVVYRPGGVASLLGRLPCAPKVPRPLHATADLEAQERCTKGGSPPRLGPSA